MDMWMNTSVRDNDIVMIYTFDEASRLLSLSSRKLLYQYVGKSRTFIFGRSDTWFLKKEFTVSLRTKKSIWLVMDIGEKQLMNDFVFHDKIIIPIMVSLSTIKSTTNTLKSKFCEKHESFRNRFLCTELKKFDNILPMPLMDHSLLGNVIYSVPVAVILYCLFSIINTILRVKIFQKSNKFLGKKSRELDEKN